MPSDGASSPVRSLLLLLLAATSSGVTGFVDFPAARTADGLAPAAGRRALVVAPAKKFAKNRVRTRDTAERLRTAFGGDGGAGKPIPLARR